MLVDFAVGLLDSVLYLPNGQVFFSKKFFQKIPFTEVQLPLLNKPYLKLINHASKNILGRLTEIDFRVSTS